MSDLRKRFMEDKALRNAAQSILASQLARLREGVSGKRVGEQLADRIGDQLLDFVGRAGTAVPRNRGMVIGAAAVAGSVAAIWLARKPLRHLLGSTEQTGKVSAYDEEFNGGFDDYSNG